MSNGFCPSRVFDAALCHLCQETVHGLFAQARAARCFTRWVAKQACKVQIFRLAHAGWNPDQTGQIDKFGFGCDQPDFSTVILPTPFAGGGKGAEPGADNCHAVHIVRLAEVK